MATALASPVPKDGSIGRPIPGVELKLVAPDGAEIAPGRRRRAPSASAATTSTTTPAACPAPTRARSWCAGANLFSGYWPDGAGGPDADGWWATGDVAYADADGDLFLVDRLGELIIVNGFNVYPHEVELVLAAHPAVAEAAVVGVPNPQTGEAVKAFVVRGRRREPCRSSELRGALRAQPGPVQVPDRDRVRAGAAALGDRQGAQGRRCAGGAR